jgi:hypothetical protein
VATVRVLARVNGESRRMEGTDQLAAVLADPEALVWVDVTSSSPSDILPVAKLSTCTTSSRTTSPSATSGRRSPRSRG